MGSHLSVEGRGKNPLALDTGFIPFLENQYTALRPTATHVGFTGYSRDARCQFCQLSSPATFLIQPYVKHSPL